MKREARTLEIRGQRFALGPHVWLMGVVNVTPDSFSDGGLYFDAQKAVDHGVALAFEGADIIDVGGESTRPGSLPVPEAEELGRVVPVIWALRKKTSAFISVDTTKAAVAQAALKAGADIVNDTSALRSDTGMADVAARFGAAVVLMHMKGTPATMQEAPHYTDLIGEISGFLAERICAAEAAGIPRERIVVDPGIGFGKGLEHNLEILRRQEAFLELGRPLLVGFSRKAFLGAILDLPPGERLEGTIAAAVISVAHGAHILRVHDVGPVSRAVRSAEAILGIAGDNGAACAGARSGAPTAASNAANGRAGHVR